MIDRRNAIKLSVTPLCSEGPLFRKSYNIFRSQGPIFRRRSRSRRSCIPKVLCSEITRFYVPKVLCSENKSKVLYSEGSIFRRFYIPKVLCSEKLEGSIFRRFYVPFYRATHVFPEWHHNCVGSCKTNWVSSQNTYLVCGSIFIIIFHTVHCTGNFQCITYRALRQFPINQYPMDIVSSRAPALMPPPPPLSGYSAISVPPLCNSIAVMRPG